MIEVAVINKSSHKLPDYQTESAAGMDLQAHLPDGSVQLAAGEYKLIPTGLSIELPHGYEAQVRPRSGLALKKGVTVLNAPGTIDADYRGDIGVILINHSKETFTIENGDRIAQLVVAKHEQISWKVSEELRESNRGTGGFGSTGVSLKK